MTKKIEICSNALILLGHKPISSFEEPGSGALLAKNLYNTTYLNFLSSNNWAFAKKYIGLNRLADTPLHPDYQYQFQLPSDYVRIETTVPVSDYKIFEDKLYSNSADLGLNYFYNIREELLPPYAVAAMEYAMASKLAIPLTVDAKKSELYAQLYARQLSAAMSTDAQGIPSVGWASTPILDVRFG